MRSGFLSGQEWGSTFAEASRLNLHWRRVGRWWPCVMSVAWKAAPDSSTRRVVQYALSFSARHAFPPLCRPFPEGGASTTNRPHQRDAVCNYRDPSRGCNIPPLMVQCRWLIECDSRLVMSTRHLEDSRVEMSHSCDAVRTGLPGLIQVSYSEVAITCCHSTQCRIVDGFNVSEV